ncbi:hypothetical protein [Streptomyces abyssomicinicus]|uniref:hypothetical protein n=1 Tax=Streptomyces abyssomicinicus TaxID=574929 RepID=UPI00124F994F|nr:hypothetical protein [Streptomyces abyssomicinicus]
MITRRDVLTTATGLAGAAALTTVGGGGTAHAAPRPGRRGAASANGWPIDPGAITEFTVSGAGRTVALHRDAAAVLLHVARRWHYEVRPLTEGTHTVTGHTTDRRAAADQESDHLSGTAICLHPHAWPAGGAESMGRREKVIVRDILADCEGAVRWGADMSPATLSHFQIDVAPDSGLFARVAAKVGGWERHPGQGPGTGVDVTAPGRREKARRLEREHA